VPALTPPRFRIYYGRDSGFATYEGDPYFAPPMDGQVIIQDNRTGAMSGKFGWYWKPDSGWHSCDEGGYRDYMFGFVGPKAFVFGREMERDQEFFDLVRHAKAEGLG